MKPLAMGESMNHGMRGNGEAKSQQSIPGFWVHFYGVRASIFQIYLAIFSCHSSWRKVPRYSKLLQSLYIMIYAFTVVQGVRLERCSHAWILSPQGYDHATQGKILRQALNLHSAVCFRNFHMSLSCPQQCSEDQLPHILVPALPQALHNYKEPPSLVCGPEHCGLNTTQPYSSIKFSWSGNKNSR